MPHNTVIRRCGSLLFGGQINPATKAKKRTAVNWMQVESLETRALLTANPTPIQFDMPTEVANWGVYIIATGQLSEAYTNNQQIQIPINAYVYFDNSIGDYSQATTTTTPSDYTFEFSSSGSQFTLPGTQIVGGTIVMGVGSAPVLTFSASNGFSTPVAQGANATKIYGLFEYSVGTDGTLNVDTSNVDQFGFPFVITMTPSGGGSDISVGIDQNRADVFNLYGQYIKDQGSRFQLFQQGIQAGRYRISAPQDVVEFAPNVVPGSGSAVPVYDNGNGKLQADTTYFYWVTATSGYGETTQSNYQLTQTDPANFNDPRLAIQLSWQASPGATGYNIYRAPNTGTNASPTPGQPQYLGKWTGTINGQGQPTFLDDGTLTPTSRGIPINNYTYFPQNYYFNGALQAFFNNYTATDSFKIAMTVKTTGILHKTYELTGQTNKNVQLDGNVYTALELTGTDPDISGTTFRFFLPFFNSNMNAPGAPPPPTGMINPTDSPGVMVFGATGVFASSFGLTGISETVQLALGDAFSAAFNRGIATNFAIDPHNWASQPNVTSGGATSGGSLPNDAYFYVITAVYANGESTTSTEYAGVINTAQSPNQSVTLNFKADNAPTHYKIYRSNTSGTGYGLLTTVPNNNGQDDPLMSFTDNGSYGTPNTAITPFIYYAPNTISNWYAAFLHQNSTTNPATGISINGLAYGFPYDDQGGSSTDQQGYYSKVVIDIQPWGVSQTPPVNFDPTPNSPVQLHILTQPTSSRTGSFTTLMFRAYGPNGQRFIGGTQVTVQVVGAQGGSYVVNVNPITGLGTLTFPNSGTGYNYLKLTQLDGKSFNSKVYQVLPTSIPQSLLSLFDQQNELLSRDRNFYRVIDQIDRSRV